MINNAMILADAAYSQLEKAGASDEVCSMVYGAVSAAYQTTNKVRRICAQLVILEQLELHRQLSEQEREDLKWLRVMLAGSWNYSGIENYARTGKSHCAKGAKQ